MTNDTSCSRQKRRRTASRREKEIGCVMRCEREVVDLRDGSNHQIYIRVCRNSVSYSSRNAVIGFTRIARCAGRREAMAAMTISAVSASNAVARSVGSSPKS